MGTSQYGRIIEGQPGGSGGWKSDPRVLGEWNKGFSENFGVCALVKAKLKAALGSLAGIEKDMVVGRFNDHSVGVKGEWVLEFTSHLSFNEKS